MELKQFELFINGKRTLSRGLDLAVNPYNGNILGNVVLVSESVLNDEPNDNEDTVRLYLD